MPFEDAVLAEERPGAAGQGVERGRVIDVLPVKIETVGLKLIHHAGDRVHEQLHVFARGPSGRPSFEILERIEGGRLDRRAFQKIVRARVHDEPHPLIMDRRAHARELLRAMTGLEIQIPVFPQQHFRLKQDDVAVVFPGAQLRVGRIARLPRPVPHHTLFKRLLPRIGFWRAHPQPQHRVRGQRIGCYSRCVGVESIVHRPVRAIEAECAPLVGEQVVVLKRCVPSRGDSALERHRVWHGGVKHQERIAVDPQRELRMLRRDAHESRTRVGDLQTLERLPQAQHGYFTFPADALAADDVARVRVYRKDRPGRAHFHAAAVQSPA